jgi:uncharacterized membrane protein
MNPPLRLLVAVTVIAVPFWLGLMIVPAQDETQPSFAAVQEILNDNCIMCHNGPKAPKGLQLTSYELLMKGSENGAVVVPNDPPSSEIVKRVRGVSKPRMPFGGEPLVDDNIKLIEEWIAAGAKGDNAFETQPREKPQPVLKKEGVTFSDVRPIFRMRCERCHTEKGLMGPAPEGFMATSYESILDSRDRARVVPGNPSASELVRKVRGQSLPRMPFDGPPYLSDEEISRIEGWVQQGARNEAGVKAPIPVGARVRLHGRLTDARTLDDLPLGLLRGADIRKNPTVGEYVEVRGEIRADGTIAVERIRKR